MTEPEHDAAVTFTPSASSVEEATRFVAGELWAEGLLDTSEPVLELIDEVGDLVEDALVCGQSPAQTTVDLSGGSVELTVEAVTAPTPPAAFDPDLLESSLLDVIERRADRPRPIGRLIVRLRFARRLRRGDAPARAARRRPRSGASRRPRSRSRRRGSRP
jgi:hypothetical protein